MAPHEPPTAAVMRKLQGLDELLRMLDQLENSADAAKVVIRRIAALAAEIAQEAIKPEFAAEVLLVHQASEAAKGHSQGTAP